MKNIGPIDIYIANAGYLSEGSGGTGQLFATAPLDTWWRQFEINIKGSAIAAQAFLRSANPKEAVMVSMNTIAAHFRYFVPFSGYASSKAALARVMDHVAVENPHVRVYNVHPGQVETDMVKETGMSLPSYDSRKSGYPEYSILIPYLTGYSQPCSCILCVSCKYGRRVSKGKVPVGKLGCKRNES